MFLQYPRMAIRMPCCAHLPITNDQLPKTPYSTCPASLAGFRGKGKLSDFYSLALLQCKLSIDNHKSKLFIPHRTSGTKLVPGRGYLFSPHCFHCLGHSIVSIVWVSFLFFWTITSLTRFSNLPFKKPPRTLFVPSFVFFPRNESPLSRVIPEPYQPKPSTAS